MKTNFGSPKGKGIASLVSVSLMMQTSMADGAVDAKNSVLFPERMMGGLDDFLNGENSIVDQDDTLVDSFINPCTGEITNNPDDITDLDGCDILRPTPSPTSSPTTMPSESQMPSASPSSKPTLSSAPTSPPSSKPTLSSAPTSMHSMTPSVSSAPTVAPSPQLVDKIVCPGLECAFEEDDENVVVSRFQYIVETSPDVDDPTSVLPELEETLLAYLAGNMLDHCMGDGDIRNLLASFDSATTAPLTTPRYSRRLAPTGICSEPADTLNIIKSCEPVIDPANKCFVIDGGISVSAEPGDDHDAISKRVQDFSETAMTEDALLSDEYPEVKEVRFLPEDDGSGGGVVIIDDDERVIAGIEETTVERSSNLGLIIGSSFAALAALIGFLLLLGKKSEDEKDVDDLDEEATIGSFVSPDSRDLGKDFSCKDVHHCQSCTCKKCYENPGVTFIPCGDSQCPPINESYSEDSANFSNVNL